MEKGYTFKDQSLENGVSLPIFQAVGNILLQRCRASMTKHRQQELELRNRSSMESGLFFSVTFVLLHYICSYLLHSLAPGLLILHQCPRHSWPICQLIQPTLTREPHAPVVQPLPTRCRELSRGVCTGVQVQR